jgi:hypothetical protein
MKKLMIVLLGLTGGVAAQVPPVADVAPIVDCVRVDPVFDILFVTWGYVNASSKVVSTVPGPLNFISPSPSFDGQPLDLQPGVHHGVFQTVLDLSLFNSTTWHLGGFTDTATPASRQCPGSYLACWDTNGNGVCDPSEDVNGDHVCDARDCQGRIGLTGVTGPQGPQGPAGPAGPQGPSGISPAIRTVTVASGTATATASCNSTEVLLNGGGVCTVPNTNSISGRIASSAPSGSTGWTISCSAGQATAVTLCSLKQ